jgi:hypothetical protein
MGWKKRRQRKWKKDKEKGRWTMRMRTGREVQRGTQERRNEVEGTRKIDNENDKSEGITLEGSRFNKKRTRILGVRETI